MKAILDSTASVLAALAICGGPANVTYFASKPTPPRNGHGQASPYSLVSAC